MGGWQRKLSCLLLGTTLVTTGGCGYLIFPERVGQPQGRVDLGVVGLDALGLLFGVIPGILAFAVDFATGCIYLPPEPYADTATAIPADGARLPPGWELVAVVDPRRPGAIAEALQEQLGGTLPAPELTAVTRWQGQQLVRIAPTGHPPIVQL